MILVKSFLQYHSPDLARLINMQEQGDVTETKIIEKIECLIEWYGASNGRKRRMRRTKIEC